MCEPGTETRSPRGPVDCGAIPARAASGSARRTCRGRGTRSWIEGVVGRQKSATMRNGLREPSGGLSGHGPGGATHAGVARMGGGTARDAVVRGSTAEKGGDATALLLNNTTTRGKVPTMSGHGGQLHAPPRTPGAWVPDTQCTVPRTVHSVGIPSRTAMGCKSRNIRRRWAKTRRSAWCAASSDRPDGRAGRASDARERESSRIGPMDFQPPRQRHGALIGSLEMARARQCSCRGARGWSPCPHLTPPLHPPREAAPL